MNFVLREHAGAWVLNIDYKIEDIGGPPCPLFLLFNQKEKIVIAWSST